MPDKNHVTCAQCHQDGVEDPFSVPVGSNPTLMQEHYVEAHPVVIPDPEPDA